MPYLGRSSDFGVRNVFHFLASAGDTSVSGNDADGKALIFTDGRFVDVYLNGVRLKTGEDYNTNTANTIAGISAMDANDEVNVVVFETFNVANTVPADAGGSFGGDVTTEGTFNALGDTAAGDKANMGFTTAEGLILTGQGTTNDVTIKNDADTSVIQIPTGTDDVNFTDDISLKSDSAVIKFGADEEITLTHNHNAGLTLGGTTPTLTIGDAGALSFDFGKVITAGEGGMIITNNNYIDKYSREYHDHGHENNPTLPRGRDTKTIYGFNYRMTEMQAAVGKVQLKKLNYIIKENKKRYNQLKKIISHKFQLRKIPNLSEPIFDTFIIFIEEEKKKKEILNLLNAKGFGTKNLPDAIEWHCSAFWQHALPKKQINNSKKTKEILQKSVAIPIWLKKKIKDYDMIAKLINNI